MWNPDTRKISAPPRTLQFQSQFQKLCLHYPARQHTQAPQQLRFVCATVAEDSASLLRQKSGMSPSLCPWQNPAFYFTPTPPVSFFKSLRFLKDKRKAPCENITMETSQAHLYLPAKKLPNWSFTSYWITVGHLLSFKLLWIPYFPEKFIFRKEGGGGKGRIQYSWLAQSYCEKGR